MLRSLERPPEFTIQIRPDRGRAVVAVTGELDLATVDQLRNVIAGIRRSNRRRIVVDLREIDFIDLAGLHLLLDLHSDAELDGWGFAIVDGAPSLACLLDATRLSGHFKRAEL